MLSEQISRLEGKAARIRGELACLGSMRPQSVSTEFRDPARRKSAIYQLSYHHKIRRRSNHVWPEHLEAVRAENREFKRFKKLIGEPIDLSIELSRAKTHLLREEARNFSIFLLARIL